jgi:hypothetical protein
MMREALTAAPWILLVVGAVDVAAGYGLLPGGPFDAVMGGGELTLAAAVWVIVRYARAARD